MDAVRIASILAPQVSELSPGPSPTEQNPTTTGQDETALHDLALDQVFSRLSDDAPRAASALRVPLRSASDVEYRQAVFRGLEHPPLRTAIDAFIDGMAACARSAATSSASHYPYEAELWHLKAVLDYSAAIPALARSLEEMLPDLTTRSEGWERMSRHLTDYVRSEDFAALEAEALNLRELLTTLRVNVLIRGNKVTVAATDDEDDLSESVMATFARFSQGETIDHRTHFRAAELDHVQAWMLENIAQVHPRIFDRLTRFARETHEFTDATVMRLADEVRFYTAYLDFLAPLRGAGLSVSYPRVDPDDKTLEVSDTWDLALAARLIADGKTVVTNDLCLHGAERILVISGPNQGGKTTLARLVGQVHHLAAIGCPVPGRDTRIFLCDRVLTMFEREETLETSAGRLGAEVHRLREVFDRATGSSVIVINEAFASTALHDARILTRDVLERITRLDAIAVCVTFIDELSRLSDSTVSMVSTVEPDDPAVRTFRVVRRTADGRAFARALAAKHELTFDQLRARFAARAEEGSRP